MKKYEMKKMSSEFQMAKYEGFTLQSGFWYGRNLRGQAIATSTWTCNGGVAVYTRNERGWEMQWHDINAWYFPESFRQELENEISKQEEWEKWQR